MAKSIPLVIKHVSFKIYSAYPCRVIWKNQQLIRIIYVNEFEVLFIKRFVSPKNRISFPEVFYRKVALKNITTFREKHLCQSLFFNKVAGKKETLVQVFSCFLVNFMKFLRASFLWNTSGGCFCHFTVTHPLDNNLSCFSFFKCAYLFIVKVDNITKIGNDLTISSCYLLPYTIQFSWRYKNPFPQTMII